MQTVVRKILTNYETKGADNSKSILILHGWGQNLKYWQQVTQKLSLKHKVICLDLPGFGSTQGPFKAFGVSDYSRFVEDFVFKLKIKNPVLIGHSMGGKIAIDLVSRGFSSPKLILISPSGTGKTLFYSFVKILLIKFIKILLFWLPKNAKEKAARVLGSADYKNAGELSETFKKFVVENVARKAQKIKMPTLIIWGEKDKEVSVKNAKDLKEKIKGSDLRILWGIGHSPNIEAPERLVDLINEHI